MISMACGSVKKIYFIHLESGEDLLDGLAEVCAEKGVKNGFILGAVGDLECASVFTAAPIGTENGKLKFGYMDEPLKYGGLLGAQTLNSVEGIVCHNDAGEVSIHAHYSFTDPDGYAYGGHLPKGTKVLHDATIMLGIVEEIEMARKWDDSVNIFVFAPTQL